MLSHKWTAALTASPLLGVILYSQTDYGNTFRELEKTKSEVEQLKLNSPEYKMREVEDYLSKTKTLIEEARKIKQEAVLNLDSSVQIAKRNQQHRDKILTDIKNNTLEVEKYIVAYTKAYNSMDYDSIGLLLSNVGKKVKSLNESVDEYKKSIPDLDQLFDSELRYAVEKAHDTLKKARNNF